MCLGVLSVLLRSYAITCKSLCRQYYIRLAVQPGSHSNAVKVHLLYLICLCMFCSVQPCVSRESGPVCLD